MKGNIYKLFFYIASLQQRLKHFHLLWYFFVIIQIVFWEIILINSYIPQSFFKFPNQLAALFYIAPQPTQYHFHFYFFILSALLIIITFIASLTIHIILTPRYHSIQRVSGKLKTLQIIQIFVLYYIELTFVPGTASMAYNLAKIGQLPLYFLAIQILLFLIIPICVVFNRNQRLLGIFSSFIIFLFYLSEHNILVISIGIIISGIFYLVNQTRKFYACLIKIMIITAIWAIIQNFQPNQFNIVMSFIFLGIGIAICVFTSLIEPNTLFLMKSGQALNKFQNQCLFKIYEFIKDKQIKDLGNDKEFALQKIFIKHNQNLKQKSFQNKAILIQKLYEYQYPIQFWSKEQLLQKINQKYSIQEVTSSQNDLQYIIMGYKVKMMTKISIVQTLKQLVSSDLMSSPQKRHYLSQYIIYNFSILNIDRYLNQESFKNKRGQSDVIKLIDIQNQTKIFYDQILKSIDKIQYFWNLLLRDTINVDDLNEEIFQIQQLTQACEKKLNYLLENYHAKNEKILFFKVLKFVNPQKANLFARERLSIQTNSKNSLTNPKLANIGYIQINGKGKINKVSFKLVADVGYTEDELYQNSISTIFPKMMYQIFMKEISEAHPGSSTRLKFPILNPNQRQLFSLRKIEVMMFIDFVKGIQYLVHFDDKQFAKDESYILVQQSSQHILTVSQNFIQCFDLSLHKIKEKLYGGSLFWHQLFSEISFHDENNKRRLISNYGINTNLNSNQIQKQKQKFNMIKTNVRIYNTYEYEKKNIFLILVNNSHNSKSISHPSQQIQESIILSTHSTRKILEVDKLNQNLITDFNAKYNIEKYKNQKFFCLIPNPYFLRIRDKRQSLLSSHSKNFGFLKSVQIFFIILGLVFVSQVIGFCFVKNNRTEIFGQYYKNLQLINNQQFLLFKGYAQANILNYFLRYKQFIVQNSSSVNNPNIFRISLEKYNEFLNYHRQQLRNSINEFENEYLQTSKIWNNKFIINNNFKLNFSGYQIDTSTQQTNYFDFLENFQLSTLLGQTAQIQQIQIKAFTFLVSNYQALRNINKTFQSAQLYINNIKQPFWTAYIIFTTITIIFIILIIVLQYLIIRIELVLKSIIGICKFVFNQDCFEQIEIIKGLKQQTIQFRQCKIKHQNNNKNNQQFFKEEQTHFENNQLKQKNKIKLQNFSKSLQDLSNIQHHSNLKRNSLQNNQKKYQKDQKINQQNQCKQILGLQYESSKVIGSFIFFFILLVLISCLLFWQQILIQSEKQQILTVIKYEQQLIKGQASVFRYLNDAFQIRFTTQIFNNSIQLLSIPINYTKTFSPANNLPISFDIYMQKFFKDNNLKPCKNYYQQIKDPLNKMKKCQQIMQGLIDINYQQGLQIYQNIFVMLKDVNLEDYFSIIQSFDKNYPDYLQGMFGRQIFQLYMNDVRKVFMEGAKQHVKQLKKSADNPLSLWIVIGLLYMIGGYIIIFQKLKLKKLIGKGYFNMFPDNIMSKMKLTSYIRNQKVLQMLDKL